MRADQTIFIPGGIRRLRFSELPLSGELASVLRRFRLFTFEDLAGITLRGFQRGSAHGTTLFLELVLLVEQARQGAFATPPCRPVAAKGVADSPRLAAAAYPSVSGGAGAKKKPAGHPAILDSQHDETVFIPLEARGTALDTFPVSARLQHVFGFKRFKLASDLHGLPFSEVVEWRNCGKKTLDELRQLVHAIQHEHRATAAAGHTVVAQGPTPPVVAGAFWVPANLHSLSVSDLPLSVRLERVLQRNGVRRLGDLHGVRVGDLKTNGNCGNKTISELTHLIERAVTGELNSVVEAVWNPAEMVRTLDALVADLQDRHQEILLLRLGGKSDQVPTLKELGVKFRLTRERVRQIVARSIETIRKHGSRRLRSYLAHAERLCCENVCPLTPTLLKQWLEQSPGGDHFTLAFYVRLLAELKPSIPAWPGEQDASASRKGRSEKIERGLEAVLREGFEAEPLPEVLSQLRTKANLRKIKAAEFLGTLQHSPHFKVEFPQADAPVVRLARRSALDIARVVLQSSNSPLTPEEILARAHPIVGAEAARLNPRTLGNTLVAEKGFYLLGARSYGLRHHFMLREEAWKQVKADFKALLKQQNRPISTVEVVNSRRFNWAEQTNTYELACILREDARLVDLGKFLFALAEWGIEEREFVKDLIPKVLRDAGRPLTGTEVLTLLQQLRSVSPYSIASALRKHPQVRDYGFGHYGLKSWGDSVKGRIVTDACLVQRVIQRATPPLTFARLCEIFDVAPAGERADKLWNTCSTLPDIIRFPEDRSETTRLVHDSCRLERALAATAREVNRPLPLYELQWEVNERFGSLFATRSLDEFRRALEQSPMFLRNAANDFILDIHLDRLGLDADAIRRACAEILSESREIIGCEDLLERLEVDGKSWEELSPDILASLLRDDGMFQEVGRDRFRVKPCKH